MQNSTQRLQQLFRTQSSATVSSMTREKELLPSQLSVKNLPAMQETLVRFLGLEDPLEKEIATHSSLLAWRIPRTEEPGSLQSTGSYDLVTRHHHHHHPEITGSVFSRGQIELNPVESEPVPSTSSVSDTAALPSPTSSSSPSQYFFLPVHLMPAPVCQLLYCTTTLFKALYYSFKNVFFIFCVFFHVLFV